MATIKSYTDLEQSKKLAKILPLESADMYFEPLTGYCTEPSEVRVGDIKYAHPRSVNCWSLAALLGVLPEKYTELIKEGGMYRIIIKDSYMTCLFDNPVDACCELIVRLHELSMKQPLMIQSDCTDCKFYEGFGQCYEHGNDLIENCKDYRKE